MQFAPVCVGTRTGDFLGTAPRAKIGKYVVQNVSFESLSSAPSKLSPIDQFRRAAGVVWAEVRSFAPRSLRLLVFVEGMPQ